MIYEKKKSKNDNNRKTKYNRNILLCRRTTIIRSLSSKRKVQWCWSAYGNEDSSEERPGFRKENVNQSSRRRSGYTYKEEIKESSTKDRIRRTITLKSIKEALSKDQLKSLLDNTYDPNELIEIYTEPEITSSFAEDFVYNNVITNRNLKKKRKKIKKSNYELFPDKYSSWLKNRNKKKCNADIIFGAYLKLYKDNFLEKDPEWIDKPSKTALFHINNMCHKLTEGDYYSIIEFIEIIIPLWAKRMKEGKSFPNMRPNFDTFFVKRKMWAQRFSIFKQWSQNGKNKI